MSDTRKGGHGKRRHYFDETIRKRKIAKNTFANGEQIIYKSGKNIFCGYIISGETNVVGPFPHADANENDNNITVSTKEKPVALQRCKFNDISEIQTGSRVLLLAQPHENQFREFKVSVVLDWVDLEHVWVKLIDDESIELVSISEIYSIPDKYIDLKRRLVTFDTVVVLREINNHMCNKVDSLKVTLASNNTLRTELSDIRSELDNKTEELKTLTEETDSQTQISQTLQAKVDDLTTKLTQLELDKSTLSLLTSQLQQDLGVEKAKGKLLLEFRTTGPSKGVLLTRSNGGKGKFSASVSISLPSHDRPSAEAYQASLDKRVSDLKKVLHVISAREPTQADLVATLAAFIKKTTQLFCEAATDANLNLYKVLTPAECNDLKLLLRLPWKRFSELRTFLTNKDIPVLASEGKMREQLKTRISDAIEVGSLQMKKTVSAKPSKVAYVRTIDLEKHIRDLIKRHMQQNNMWNDMKFNGEIWIKIGGDKGGSSTKLAVQICNVRQPNSADNTDLLAFFEATDSDENMRLIFSIYTAVIEKMQRPEFELNLGPEFGNMRCRIFIFGDYEFLCKILGHLGPNSTYPCLWCYIKLEQLRNPGGQPHCPKIKDAEGHWVDREGWPNDRTVEDMVQDLEDNVLYTSQSGGTSNQKSNSSKFHSLHTQPILPVRTSMDHVVPPILHIMLGLVQRYFNMLELLCKTMDKGNMAGRDIDGKWVEITEKVQELEIDLEKKNDDLAREEILLEGFRKSSRGKEQGGASAPCAMPACAISCINPWGGRNVRDMVKWFQCSECGDGPDGEEGWFYLSCLGMGLTEYEDENFQFICPVCDGEVNGPGDVVRMCVERVKQQQKVVKKAKEEYNKQKKELDRVYMEVCKEMGPRQKELNRVLDDDLKVKRQAYHSQCFVGNHCQTILKKHEKLLDVIAGHPEETKYRQLFAKVSSILLPYSGSVFLSQNQVDELVDKCYDFGLWFPTNFVSESLPPKFHMLVCALPKCVQTWYTIGLLSEHGLEGVHAKCNADERTYCRVRDNESRINLVFRQHGQYATTNKDALKVKKRRCQNKDCKGRYITINKEKQCNLCYFHPEGESSLATQI